MNRPVSSRPLRVLTLSLILGNVLGFAEVLYMRYVLRTLHTASLLELILYGKGAASLYGWFFALLFMVLVGLFSTLCRLLCPGTAPGMLAWFLGSATLVGSFYSGTYVVYYDLPGLFELHRFTTAGLLALLLGAGVTAILRLPGLKSLLIGFRKASGRLVVPVLALNLLLVPAAVANFTPELPETPERRVSVEGPPIILIGVDTLRADHQTPFNSRLDFETPAVRQLARDGVVYHNHGAQWPKTTPSFASMFTSKYPAELPVYGNSQPIPDRETTLAERLNRAGYYTAGMVSSFAVHEKYLGQGFDVYLNREDWQLQNLKLVRYFTALAGMDLPTAYANRFLRSGPPEPFFLFLHYITPHAPYHPPYPHSVSPDPDYAGHASGDQRYLSALRRGEVTAGEEDREHVRSLYDGEVAYNDRRVGDLLETLKRRELYREALIVLVSDHGETMDQHGREHWFKHSTLYESDLNVPLVIKYPDNAHAGERVREPTSNLDVVPTILNVLDRSDTALRGEGLRGPRDRSGTEPVFAQRTDAAALRTKRWKVIHRFETDRLELYDLREDPSETRDVSNRYPAVAGRFRRRLEEFAESTYVEPDRRSLSEKERRRLQGLGYLE